MTKIRPLNPAKIDREIIQEAADILAKDGTVVFPTETVYGLGANGTSAAAVKKIFQAKKRPVDNPLILHVSSIAQVEKYGYLNDAFYRLAKAFWPGPLTMIIPKKKGVPEETSGGLSTVAVRMPNHEVALALIREAGYPIAAPSANLSGKPSPTTAQHVIYDLFGRVDMILDAGATGVGLESTVIDLTKPPFQILRPGGITADEISDILPEFQIYVENNERKLISHYNLEDLVSKSPGVKYRHYAPNAELYLVQGEGGDLARRLEAYLEDYVQRGYKVGLLITDELGKDYGMKLNKASIVLSLGSRNNLNQIAQRLYERLREMDNENVDIILCPIFPKQGIGAAIMNRLTKAADGKTL